MALNLERLYLALYMSCLTSTRDGANRSIKIPYLVFNATQGGVVGGVVSLRVWSGCQPWLGGLLITGGDRVNPGEGGGMDPQELRLEPAESTLGMLLVVGVVGIQQSEESPLRLESWKKKS